LGREGFSLVDGRSYAAIASLHNHGIFALGAMLVGSHAYGVLLNRLGVRATPYTTEDIDIARRGPLRFAEPPAQGFLDMLNDSGIEFVAVPSLDRGQPSTSFKQRGRSPFHVDLLAPSDTDSFPFVAVPELKAHAIGLPHLDFLLAESQTAMLMAREGCCAVRVPLPERFAVHKLIVSSLRGSRQAKSERDVLQACVVAAALGDSHPGAVETAVAALTKRAGKPFRMGIDAARRWLERDYPRAWQELTG
ncbi:MAG TPA: GSU2403 family nucleotidyltransferase fold protein, partial [Vicinamibacterales bacterium]|nr:GSU2403 family nucleotidyltransferase fold protein [Vicinamibacterales bacterium]